MKSFIIAGLLAVSSVAVIAAPAKTSKPVALSESQMESVKGQSTLTVYIWNHNNSGNFYTTVIAGQFIGMNGYEFQVVYGGGPQAGTYFVGYEPIPSAVPSGNPWVTAYGPVNPSGNYNNWHPFLPVAP